MWPIPLDPISMTATSVSSGALASVMGTPSSLLNDRCEAVVTNRDASALASRSFVVVLPTDPVIPTTRSGSRLRATEPIRVSAAAVSATTIDGTPSTGRSTSAAAAPAAAAAATNSWPSRSARRATNS